MNPLIFDKIEALSAETKELLGKVEDGVYALNGEQSLEDLNFEVGRLVGIKDTLHQGLDDEKDKESIEYNEYLDYLGQIERADLSLHSHQFKEVGG